MRWEIEMAETEITFHNKASIKVQAQVYVGRALLGTCVAEPGENATILAELMSYDIFIKNSATGREIVRVLSSKATEITLSQRNGRYVLT
jgi:hypothetical protein